MILSPASLVGLQRSDTQQDECSRRYAQLPPRGSSPAGDSAGDSVSSSMTSLMSQPKAGGTASASTAAALPSAPSVAEAAPPGKPQPSGHSADLAASGTMPKASSSLAGWTPRNSRCASSSGTKDAPSSPAPGSKQILVDHLQGQYSKLDRKGAGEASTVALLRGLQTLVASQAASLRASRGWATGVRQVCANLEATVEAARLGGDLSAVGKLVTRWDELMDLADRVQHTVTSDHPLGR